MSHLAADPAKGPEAPRSRISLLSLSLLAAISAVMLSFAPALAAIVALTTLLYTSAAGTPSSPDSPILKARSAIHAPVTKAGGSAPEFASDHSAGPEDRSTRTMAVTMPPSVRPDAEPVVNGEPVPADAGLRAVIFEGALLGDRAPPRGPSRQLESPDRFPSQESRCGVSVDPQDSPCTISPAAPTTRADLAALREPDVLISPADRRRPASSERLGPALIVSVKSSGSGRIRPQASPVPTLPISALRI